MSISQLEEMDQRKIEFFFQSSIKLKLAIDEESCINKDEYIKNHIGCNIGKYGKYVKGW